MGQRPVTRMWKGRKPQDRTCDPAACAPTSHDKKCQDKQQFTSFTATKAIAKCVNLITCKVLQFDGGKTHYVTTGVRPCTHHTRAELALEGGITSP